MFHFQRPVPDWPRAIARLPAGYVIKAIDHVQMLSEVKAHNPELKTILRHWYTAQVPSSPTVRIAGEDYTDDYVAVFQTYADSLWKSRSYGSTNPLATNDVLISEEIEWLQVAASSDEANEAKARIFFDSFIDDTFMYGSTAGINHAQATDYIEEWNEYFANSQSAEEKGKFISWARAAAKVWATEYRIKPELAHIRLILANTAIGNDIPLAVAQAAKEFDAVIGYHPYWPVRNDVVPADEWPWYSGRWTQMDAEYRAQGVSIEWVFTEAGAVGYHGEWPYIGLNPNDGWLLGHVHGGSVDQYLNTISRWMTSWSNWNKNHGHRALPPVLFNSGAWGGAWTSYELNQPEMDVIADFVNQWPVGSVEPQPPPPPPPPPPPEECRGAPRVDYNRTVVLFPPKYPDDNVVEIVKAIWPLQPWSFGPSADDGGIGDLDYRRVLAINPDSWSGAGELEKFYQEHYPGVEMVRVEGSLIEVIAQLKDIADPGLFEKVSKRIR